MCTYHQSQLQKARRHAKVKAEQWDQMVEGFAPFSETGIEPTHVIPILTGEREVVKSSWGFRRAFKRKDGKGKTAAKPVVNAQSEKMDSFMWRDAYQNRRCVIAVTAFYEWTWKGRAMTAHRFHRGGEPFLVAGLWEEGSEVGTCHTMVTTLPNREVAATGHDRCLVVLTDREVDPWLAGEAFADFHRPDGLFQVDHDVSNPRAKRRDEGDGWLL